MTTPTSVSFELSDALQQTLAAHDDTYVSVYAFGGGGTSPPLVASTYLYAGSATGILPNQISTSISLPNALAPAANFSSGNIYILIGRGTPFVPTAGSDMKPEIAQSNNYSYQMIEASLQGGAGDLGDISSVNTFGFATALMARYGATTFTYDSRGFLSNANELFASFPAAAIQEYTTPINSSNNYQLALGPAQSNTAWPATDWTAYINKLKSDAFVQNDIDIVSVYGGGNPLQQEAQLSQYGLQYVASDPVFGNDFFWLVPNISNGATNTNWIYLPANTTSLTGNELISNIYTQGGKLTTYQSKQSSPGVFDPSLGPDINNKSTFVSYAPNNAIGAVMDYVVAGFDAGYWGGHALSPNPAVGAPIDFNQNWNWNIDYAYNATIGSGSVGYANALGTGPGTSGGNNRFYDPWAQAVVVQSNAYGYSFSDLVSAGGINPQISVYDKSLSPEQNVTELYIKLFDNAETAPPFNATTGDGTFPATPGYRATPPTYVAPTNSVGATTPTTNELSFQFGLTAGPAGGQVTLTPDPNTPIQFRVYAPGSSQASSDGFMNFQVFAPTAGTAFYQYKMVESGGVWSLTEFTTAGAGGLAILDVPATSDGSISWYQLVYGAPGAQSIYNIYADTDHARSHAITALYADHGAGIQNNGSPNHQTASYWGLDYTPGPFYDIATLVAPVLGGSSDGTGNNSLLLENGAQLAYWELSGTTVTSSGTIDRTLGAGWSLETTGDFNGDGKTDLMLQNGQQLAEWMLNGPAVLAESGNLAVLGAGWSIAGTGDFAGDGKSDLLLQNGQQLASWEMTGLAVTGGGNIGDLNPGWMVEGTGDFNGDGKSDILLQNGNDLAIWLMNGTTVLDHGNITSALGSGWSVVGLGDFNGDTKSDLLLERGGNLAMWFMDSFTVASSGTVSETMNSGWEVSGTADVTDDGKADIILEDGQQVAVWIMDSTTVGAGSGLVDELGSGWSVYGTGILL